MTDLPPYPTGWYALATATELAPGEVVERTCFGERVALYRTESGLPGAMLATCPHLGANLARGTVCGEHLRCPFHHFEFDRGGRCVKSGYDGPPPKRTRTRTLPVVERNGFVLIWWDEGGEEPHWEIPEHDLVGFNAPITRTLTLRGHPQETTENSVDIGHFAIVHGFHEVAPIAPLHIEGPLLTAAYRFVHALGPIRWLTTFSVEVWGLGYSMVDVQIPRLGVELRLFVLPLPTGERQLELRLGAAGRGRGPLAWLQQRVLRRVALEMLCEDARQDVPIWESRTHVERPSLARGDGPIGPYRRWARQFYPDLQAAKRGVA